MLAKHHQQNLQTLLQAARNGHLAVVECQDKATGQPVAILCALSPAGEEVDIVPFARMFAGNPYDELNPPNPDGGFRQEEP